MQVEREAFGWKVAHGCVTRRYQPFSLGQQRETAANTGYVGNGKDPQGLLKDEPAAHQLVGEVMAHQGEDG